MCIYISLRHSMRPFRTPPKRLPAAVPFPPRRRCQRLEILQACTGWQFHLLQEKARLHLRPLIPFVTGKSQVASEAQKPGSEAL